MSSTTPKYDVFLSFRGEDTRRTFVSHLIHSLAEQSISVFDNETLMVSESPRVGIRSSKTAIVVISENYASSPCCLDELVHILKYHTKLGPFAIIPVHYGVKHKDVYRRTGKFGEQFLKQQRENPNKKKRWRVALKELAYIFGFESEDWEDEAELIQTIINFYDANLDEGTLGTWKRSFGVSDISNVPGRSVEEWKMVLSKYEQSSDEGIIGTSKSSFGVADDENRSLAGKKTKFNCVGMDCHIEAVCGGLMKLKYDKEISIVGIWGVGGVGKTTLARCVYEETMPHFHTHSFLENVGKIYQDHGSLHLQEDVLFENIQRSSKNGSDVTKAGLRNRKVLLIVDGVNNDKQIEDVKKVATWFGAGSRVMVTTRDENLLVDNGVKHVYEVKCLKVHEALQLFYQFAFKQQPPSTRFKRLSVRAVQLSGRIPLALEVLASFLQGKSEYDWESVLQKLERQGGKYIVEVAQTHVDVVV